MITKCLDEMAYQPLHSYISKKKIASFKIEKGL